MRANVFHAKNKFQIEEVEQPRAGVGEAVIRVTLTTICGTDLHIVRGEYPVAPGLVIGHEPVGVIEELGPDRLRLADQHVGCSAEDAATVMDGNARHHAHWWDNDSNASVPW